MLDCGRRDFCAKAAELLQKLADLKVEKLIRSNLESGNA